MAATTNGRDALPEYVVPAPPPTPKWVKVVRVPADGSPIHEASARMVCRGVLPELLESPGRTSQFCMSKACYLSTLHFVPWVATWGKEGWEKRAVIGHNDIHIIYTQAEGSLIPNKHADGRVSGDIILAKIAAQRGRNGWYYEDVDPEWMGKYWAMFALSYVKSMLDYQAHGYPKSQYSC